MHGDATKQNNQLGLKQGDLTFEIRRACRNLSFFRRTVSRRMAFHDVRYIDVVAALQIDGQQHRIKQSTRLPDKRLALFILLSPRPFADKQPVGLLITDARNNQLALRTKRAGTAFGNTLAQFSPTH